jgi:DNA-binding MurR/RpiR family transcriptional regulator
MSQNRVLEEEIILPDSQEQVIEKLLEQFESFPAQLQIVARYIIDHPYEVGVQTMRNLATKAKVHPNSFVRLARQIGFDGYESMRERFRDFVRSGAGSTEQRALWLQKMEKAEGSSRVVAEMTESMLGNLEQMMQSQDVEKMDQAVKMMLEAERVFVLGLGVGYPLAYNFWYVARMISESFILIPRHGSLAMDDLVNIREKDLLLCMTFQPYRTDVLEALRYAKDQGASTIGITDSPASALYRESELGLYSPTHTPQFFHSNVAVIGLLETLTALLVAKGGKKSIRHMEKFSELRWKSGIYEE